MSMKKTAEVHEREMDSWLAFLRDAVRQSAGRRVGLFVLDDDGKAGEVQTVDAAPLSPDILDQLRPGHGLWFVKHPSRA